jgi:hypothetical protein
MGAEIPDLCFERKTSEFVIQRSPRFRILRLTQNLSVLRVCSVYRFTYTVCNSRLLYEYIRNLIVNAFPMDSTIDRNSAKFKNMHQSVLFSPTMAETRRCSHSTMEDGCGVSSVELSRVEAPRYTNVENACHHKKPTRTVVVK